MRRRPSEAQLREGLAVAEGYASQSSAADPLLLYLLVNARSAAVREEFLKLPSTSYTATHDVKIFAGTYNVNGQMPEPGMDLEDWLGHGRSADIVAVGFQETVPLSATNVVLGGSGENAVRWDNAIARTLNRGLDRGRTDSSAPEAVEPEASVAVPAAASEAALESAQGGKEESPADVPAQRAAHHERFLSAEGADFEQVTGAGPSPGPLARVNSPALSSDASEYISGDETLDVSIDEDPSLFVQVASRQLVGVYLSIWVRNSFRKHVSGIQGLTVATGMMGYLGNKGGVAVRMRVFDTGVCFVSSHLSSGEALGDDARRNYDHQEILRRGFFSQPVVPEGAGADAAARAVREEGPWGTSTHLLSTHHLFWMGDLNYRLTGPMNPAVVAEKIRRREFESLLQRDQLRSAMAAGVAFRGWVEAPIRFPPTFKFKRGTKTYLGLAAADESTTLAAAARASADEEPSATALAQLIAAEDGPLSTPLPEAATQGSPAGLPERPRMPAWTDRILFRSRTPADVRQLSYTATESICMSDHRPVSAAFILRTIEYRRREVDRAIQVARQAVDAKEMAATPYCRLSPTAVDLGTIAYDEAVAVSVVVRNEGNTPASFRAVPSPAGTVEAPWLELLPSGGAVPVGGKCTLALRARVFGGPAGCAESLMASMPSAPRRDGCCPLETVLVLRVEGGNDMFLAVNGRFRPSWMGLSLLTLAERMPLPVRGDEAAGVAEPPERPVQEAGSAHATGADASPDEPAGTECRAAEPAGSPHSDDNASDPDRGPESDAPSVARGEHDPPAAKAAGDRQRGVPWEIDWLVETLAAPEALTTCGIFLVDTQTILPGSATPDPAVCEVRRALELGKVQDALKAKPRDVAATLLAALAALPEPILPKGAKDLCDAASYSSAATPGRLVREALSGSNLELYERVMGLFRDALKEEYTEMSGLTAPALSVVLADVFFPPLPSELHAAGDVVGQTAASGLGAAAQGIAAIDMRRIQFLQHLLEDPATGS